MAKDIALASRLVAAAVDNDCGNGEGVSDMDGESDVCNVEEFEVDTPTSMLRLVVDFMQKGHAGCEQITG